MTENEMKIDTIKCQEAINYMEKTFVFDIYREMYIPKENGHPFDSDDIESAFMKGFEKCFELLKSGAITL